MKSHLFDRRSLRKTLSKSIQTILISILLISFVVYDHQKYRWKQSSIVRQCCILQVKKNDETLREKAKKIFLLLNKKRVKMIGLGKSIPCVYFTDATATFSSSSNIFNLNANRPVID